MYETIVPLTDKRKGHKMVSIDTIISNGPVRNGDRTFAATGAVPIRLWLKAFVAAMRSRAAMQRTRMHLRELTDDQLRDIGVTREDACFEADKSAWFDFR
jgi:uncharacterized protein YjiS (DUF1127 family)